MYYGPLQSTNDLLALSNEISLDVLIWSGCHPSTTSTLNIGST
jgi:hypothetical protein